MALGCFLSAGRSFARSVDRLRLAEDLGYDAAYVEHVAGAESLTLLAAWSQRSERIALGTAVVPIHSRTPATMAQTAATLHAVSGGRARLGLGTSTGPIVERWHGQEPGDPRAELPEYLRIVRAILDGEQAPAGERWRTSFRLRGLPAAPDLPLYAGVLHPDAIEAAAAVADGVLLWLAPPGYVRDVVVPAVRAGRAAAGKPVEGFAIVAAVGGATGGEPDGVRDAAREGLRGYLQLGSYADLLDRAGLAEERAAATDPDADPTRRDAAADRLLDALAGIGDPDAVAAAVARMRDAGATEPAIVPLPGGDREATLRAAVRN
ncbi:LLM class flavin-dependent oxidoreductase [Patulibacter defluvii]|uniref:LLM class flavin-dependent oxidoreductase n=1 Tax=Patulibacter defluvii TaxID=3095358 RepID=UPI002A753DD6|nr:LLM class flavin-dependent oxidoreductase [Patulibacter sp. DM4]